jgi:hypothetical protein
MRNNVSIPPRGALRRVSGGQMVVVVAFAVTALVGSIALGVDIAVLYFNWMELQKAADAAATAGANYLPEMPDTAVSTANGYAASNGILAAEIVSTQVNSGDTQITINLRRTVPYYFARVLGLSNGQVAAASTASVSYSANEVGVNGDGSYGASVGQFGIVPIGIDSATSYQRDQPVTLNYGQVGAGNWGSLALGGDGGNNLRTNIANGYNGPISIGDWITTEPGKKVGPIDQGFGDRLTAGENSYPSGTFSSHDLNDPRVITIPMVNWANINGRSQVQVTGFAELWLDSVSGGTIDAHFIEQVTPDSSGSASAPSNGAQSPPVVIG